MFDAEKFSWTELFTSNNGKTSSTQFIGVISSMVSLGIFVSLIVFYFYHTGESETIMELIDKATLFFGIASGLMGVKTLTASMNSKQVNILTKEEKPSLQSEKKETTKKEK